MLNSVDIRLPELSGGTEAEQLHQLQRYLYHLAEQLQYAFASVPEQPEQSPAVQSPAVQIPEKTPAQTFSSIKSLIIKSADIVESYTDRIERSLSGSYVAQSQFGTFRQETEQRIEETAEATRQSFRNIQALQSLMEGIEDSLLAVNAYIRTGLLYSREDGSPVYGMEIGQQEQLDGTVRFRKFARLTADRLGFYDSNDTEVAYISEEKLHVTGAQIRSLTAAEGSLTRLRMGEYTCIAAADGHLTLC